MFFRCSPFVLGSQSRTKEYINWAFDKRLNEAWFRTFWAKHWPAEMWCRTEPPACSHMKIRKRRLLYN
ncbi:hypothetical protein F0562_016843 [Nyssa sinensis]|uniref:Uncharacterized protein n=1 Tax=Nyssa sinensis TaxID=561372 RepID=A0A5J4ZH36_9ASTE|nr:hypothetical protein F0562_016843 [Nyssa sinensis]